MEHSEAIRIMQPVEMGKRKIPYPFFMSCMNIC